MAAEYFRKKFKGYDPYEVDQFIASLNSELEDIKASSADEIRSLKAELKSRDNEIAKMEKELDELKKESEDKLMRAEAKYDSLCAQLGERMNKADERADAIIADSEQKREKILSDARKAAEAESRRIIEDTRVRCNALEKATQSFAKRQKDITEGLEMAKRSIEEGLSDIAGNLGENNAQ